MRMCIDFRTLNANLHVDQYPIQHIDDLLNQLHGGYVFLKIDLHAGYLLGLNQRGLLGLCHILESLGIV